MANDALRLCDVDAFYGDSHVLQNVSFALGQGRLLGLLGRNGAGKTTCMNVTMGLLPPRSGAGGGCPGGPCCIPLRTSIRPMTGPF